MSKKSFLRKIGIALVFSLLLSVIVFVPATQAQSNVVTINDNERDWCGDEYYIAPPYWNQMDHVRYVTSRGEQPWKQMRPEAEDPDNFAFTWVINVNASAPKDGVDTPIRNKKMDQSIYKVLPEPLKGGKFSFYMHSSNTVSVGFGLEAIGYDKDGVAHSLGQETYNGAGIQAGWNYYEKSMPTDVIIEKMEIKIFGIPNFVVPEGKFQAIANFCNVDDIRFTDTTKPLDVQFDGEDPTTWEIDYGVVDQLTDLNRPDFIIHGTSSLDFLTDFLMNGNPRSSVTLHKNYETGIKGGRFSFKVFNVASNPRTLNSPQTKLKVVAILADNSRFELGKFPKNDTDVIEYGGYPTSKMNFFGYQYCQFDLPTDKVIKGLDIVFSETTGAKVTGNYFIDEVRFINTLFNAGTGSDNSSSADNSNNSTTGNNNTNSGNPATSDNWLAYLMLVLLSGSFVFVYSIRKNATNKN